jgi:N-acetylglutamate synthase-like GNAT family acetyltransferase
MENFVIRRAKIADANQVAELSGILSYPVESEAMRRRLERLGEREHHVIFVADTGTNLAGWIHGAERSLLVVERMAEICGLVVGAGHRGSGVGRRLVEAVENWARGRGFKEVSVRSNVARLESHPFYEKLGFDRTKTQHVYRKRLVLPDS